MDLLEVIQDMVKQIPRCVEHQLDILGLKHRNFPLQYNIEAVPNRAEFAEYVIFGVDLVHEDLVEFELVLFGHLLHVILFEFRPRKLLKELDVLHHVVMDFFVILPGALLLRARQDRRNCLRSVLIRYVLVKLERSPFRVLCFTVVLAEGF